MCAFVCVGGEGDSYSFHKSGFILLNWKVPTRDHRGSVTVVLRWKSLERQWLQALHFPHEKIKTQKRK